MTLLDSNVVYKSVWHPTISSNSSSDPRSHDLRGFSYTHHNPSWSDLIPWKSIPQDEVTPSLLPVHLPSVRPSTSLSPQWVTCSKWTCRAKMTSSSPLIHTLCFISRSVCTALILLSISQSPPPFFIVFFGNVFLQQSQQNSFLVMNIFELIYSYLLVWINWTSSVPKVHIYIYT